MFERYSSFTFLPIPSTFPNALGIAHAPPAILWVWKRFWCAKR